MKQNLKSISEKKAPKRPMLKPSKSLGQVVWAIDSTKLNEELVKRFQDLFKSMNIVDENIIPTTVFSPFDTGLFGTVEKDLKKKTMNRLEQETQKQWKQYAFSYKKSGFLVSESNSKRDRAMALIRFAEKKKAKVIVVGSGAKSRDRLTGLGSFSEALISLSPIPVIVLGESVQTTSPVSKILYPTDFSETSKATFKKVIQFAKVRNAEVVLYHFLNLEQGPLIYGIPWSYEIMWLDEYWKNQDKLQQEEAEKWKNIAVNLGVKCQYICDRRMGQLSERIVEMIKENKTDILAITVKRGPWSQVILGRNVRELFAHSPCPVLVIHENLKKKTLHS